MSTEHDGQKEKPRPADSDADADRRAREEFERGLIERGEAAVADEKGRLPPGVTHEIVGYEPNGRAILKRRRFSIF
jgi:hypothetical protein